MANTYPKLHNAGWPGLVGKGEGAEPVIDLDTMIALTAAAEVDDQKFDGMDLFLSLPHIDIDSSDEQLKEWADKLASKNLAVGSCVAPVWPDAGGGTAFGSEADRKQFCEMVRKACVIVNKFNDLGVRKYGCVRIDTAGSPSDFVKDPKANQKKNIETFKEACKIAEDHGEKLAAEGEICWGGMHGWKSMLELLEGVNKPEILGLQADMANTMLYMLGFNAEEDSLVPAGFNWEKEAFDESYKKLTDMLRPWLIDFHVAQNDATVFGSGSHDKTGRHCLVGDPNGKLDIPYHAGFWLRDENGELTKKLAHLCWDGCMFPNAVLESADTWNAVLGEMIKVREQHGWS
jgi:sugar phosphate isomerase/epimerase